MTDHDTISGMKCIDCAFEMADGLCLSKWAYAPPDADACESFRPGDHAQAMMLKAENAKLRELVRDMWVYDYARHWSSLGDDIDHRASVWRRMRELGIEVDEFH